MAVVFTNAGKAIITNRIIAGGTEPKFVAMGTDATAAAATDTALGTEVETRATGTSSRVTTTVTNDTYQVIGTITATATRAITESGLFDASSTGNMLTSADFSTINLASGDSIQFTWQLKFS
jgi:hypothetical protein